MPEDNETKKLVKIMYNGDEYKIESIDYVDDTPFDNTWDGDTTHSPSKNAIYDVLGDVETLLANL